MKIKRVDWKAVGESDTEIIYKVTTFTEKGEFDEIKKIPKSFIRARVERAKNASYATGWVDATQYIAKKLKGCYIVVDPAKQFEAEEEGYMKGQVDDIIKDSKSKQTTKEEKA